MAVALREAVERHTAHQELLERTVDHIVDAARLHALAVIEVVAVHIGPGIVTQGRVAIHLERCGQHLLAHHILKSLTTFLQPMSLQAVPEDLMKEDAAGRSRQHGRSRIGIGHRSLAQCLDTPEQILGGSHDRLLRGQRVGRESKEVLIQRQAHAVLGNSLHAEHEAGRDTVLHDISAIGIDEISP